ncbi:hypothetical protein GCM10020220_066000 [Nonomuraea rubra]
MTGLRATLVWCGGVRGFALLVVGAVGEGGSGSRTEWWCDGGLKGLVRGWRGFERGCFARECQGLGEAVRAGVAKLGEAVRAGVAKLGEAVCGGAVRSGEAVLAGAAKLVRCSREGGEV